VALQQQRGTPTTRSSVGSVTTLSNLPRMLYSRAGDYPPGQPIIYAEAFSPNTPEGACPECHGHGRIYTVTEQSMVPDPSLTIPERAVAAWPQAWGGQNQRDILVTLGYDVDRPWRDLPQGASGGVGGALEPGGIRRHRASLRPWGRYPAASGRARQHRSGA
jgi:excinuclease ABC subunit A